MSKLITKEYALELVNELVEKRAKILDVGCADGEFEHQLREEGYFDITGIDKENCDISKNIPMSDKLFDVVTAWEVFEHLENPQQAVREVYFINA